MNDALLQKSGSPGARVAALVAWQDLLMPYFRDLYRERLLAVEPDAEAVRVACQLAGKTEPLSEARAFLLTDPGCDQALMPAIRALVGYWTNLCVWVARTYERATHQVAFDAAMMPVYPPPALEGDRSWERAVERCFHGLLTTAEVRAIFGRVKAERAPDQPLPEEARAAIASYGVDVRTAG